MGGVGSTVQFEKAPPGLCSVAGSVGPSEKRDEGPSLPVPASSVKRKPHMSLWLTQDGDRTLDAVIHALHVWDGSNQEVEAPVSFSCFSSSSGCLLEHRQLLLAWRMSRIGAPGRCGCCESLLPLGGPKKGVPGGRDASEKGFTRPCSGSSNTNIHRSTPPGGSTPRRGVGGPDRSSWRRVVGAGVPQPDPSSCYLVIHAYTADQQQQQEQQHSESHTPEGPADRRGSITPPRAHSPTGAMAHTPSTTEKAYWDPSNSGSNSFRAAAELLSEDLAHLLTQAETRIAADTRRHSVWHAVHFCGCCSQSKQQQQQQQQQLRSRDRSRSSTESQEIQELPCIQPGSHSGEQQQQREQQQLQRQHLWAVYLWEGVEAPRYILVSLLPETGVWHSAFLQKGANLP